MICTKDLKCFSKTNWCYIQQRLDQKEHLTFEQF